MNNLYVVLILLVTLSLHANAVKQEFKGHFYELQTTPATYSSALAACKQLPPYNGMQGYLATITSKQENDWIVEKFLSTLTATQKFWISGQMSKSGQFFYSSGPENGTLLYDRSTLECGMFCGWNQIEPNFNDVETNIAVEFNYYSPVKYVGQWNNWSGTLSAMYLCEFGGMEDPFIPSVRTVGVNDTATINNILNLNLLNKKSTDVSVTFVNDDGRTFKASDIYITSDTTLLMTIPPGSGMYNVTITVMVNSNTVTLKTTYQYKPPQLSIVVPALSTGSTITLVGDNLVDLKTSVFLTNQSVACNNVQLVKQGVITCQTFVDLTGLVIVPITINVDSVYSINNNPAFNYVPGNGYYQCFRTYTNLTNSLQFAHDQTVRGMSGYLSYVSTKAAKQIASNMCPDMYYTTSLSMNNNNQIITSDDPNIGSIITLDPTISVSGMGGQYYLSPRNGYLRQAPTMGDGTFLQLIYKNNFQMIPRTSTYVVPTMGDEIDLELFQVGSPLDITFYTYNGGQQSVIARDYYSDHIYIVIPPDAGPSKQLLVSFQPFGSTTPVSSVSITIDRLRPSINSLSFIEDTIGSNVCSNITMMMPHKSLTCVLESRLPGPPVATVSVNGAQSLPFTYSFMAPVVRWTTPGIVNKTTLITIIGNNFSPVNLTVQIGGAPCYSANVTNSTTIQCLFDGTVQMPPNQIDSLAVNVSSQGEFGFNIVFYYINITQLNCSGNGDAVGGRCVCKEGWTKQDCSVKAEISTGEPVIEHGSVRSLADGTLFNTSIVYLREVDGAGATIKTLALSSITWKDVSSAADTSDGAINLVGTFSNDNATMDMHIKHFKTADQVTFAGETMYMPANSVKFTVGIREWTFKSKLHTLQVVFESKTAREKGPCIQAKSMGGINSYYIELDRSVLYGSFAGHLYTDGRVVTSVLKDIESTDVLYVNNTSELSYRSFIEVPAFDTECIVDPNFQSLVKVNEGGEGEATSCLKPDKDYTKLIIIVVVCSVAGAAIILASILLIRKYKYQLLSHAPSSLVNMRTIKKT
ncbi:hypothetical protein SAMD00019534_029220 [Acytostelium subglobosum LB1]|uniref:hypothetical protein n=1 Tax=Acytostelium subglobosum LB1 TaxID=1410327 RepID=UPI000644C273|nr:hypothetical protein SAMD00019534_029220 [Acytostelium subglobosum LB1]GAM19747.1 hypothetical protein SAMD00019534_029220 [Acytostelium subglobosum LB1]|eukprot:XP_012756509.1 hypothetical protein SAMD00019534_029220 [Acytostelium subglobosum LB1]